MIRTKRFNDIMVKIASRHPSFWRAYGNLSIVVSFVLIALATYTLGINLYNFAYVPRSANPIIPIVPGVTIGLTYLPYLLLAIGVAITIHEGSHGIIASEEKIGLKSSGIVIAPITFGGFVEPDEEQFEKSELLSKLRVLSSGSFTNMLAGLLSILLIITLFASQSGVLVTSVQVNGPAAKAGMQDWEVIYSINGNLTPDYTAMRAILATVKPGETATLDTSRGQLYVVTIPNLQNSSVAFLGITSLAGYNYHPLRIGEFSIQFTYNFKFILDWMQLVMVNLAIFNMLPMFPLDGDGFVYAILKAKLKKRSNEARTVVNMAAFSLLGLNIALSFIRYGITPI
jgi:membrane-associated protease RseP (regulator of RpoE activity)